MNKQILKKIKSESGASLVLAILVFLICALVGSTILAAATASSGTITTSWHNEKDVYTLKSAETLFEQNFENKTWKSADETNRDTTTYKITDVPTVSTMDNLYRYLCCKTYNDGSAVQTIEYTLGSTSVSSTPVDITVNMDDKYNITAVFSMKDSTRTIKLYLPGTVGSDSEKVVNYTVSWSQPVVTVL